MLKKSKGHPGSIYNNMTKMEHWSIISGFLLLLALTKVINRHTDDYMYGEWPYPK